MRLRHSSTPPSLAAAALLRGVVLIALVLVASAARRPRLPAELAEWSAGAVRWLLLPNEAHDYENLQSPEEARGFIRSFWERRNPDPGRPVNAYAQSFFDRVAMADKLYGEDDLRGSLTERGGALILLGPPSVLRVLRRKIPALDASRPGRRGEMQDLPVEVWAYHPDDVPALLRLEPKLAEADEISVTFAVAGKHATLLEGRGLFKLAAKAAVLRP